LGGFFVPILITITRPTRHVINTNCHTIVGMGHNCHTATLLSILPTEKIFMLKNILFQFLYFFQNKFGNKKKSH